MIIIVMVVMVNVTAILEKAVIININDGITIYHIIFLIVNLLMNNN